MAVQIKLPASYSDEIKLSIDHNFLTKVLRLIVVIPLDCYETYLSAELVPSYGPKIDPFNFRITRNRFIICDCKKDLATISEAANKRSNLVIKLPNNLSAFNLPNITEVDCYLTFVTMIPISILLPNGLNLNWVTKCKPKQEQHLVYKIEGASINDARLRKKLTNITGLLLIFNQPFPDHCFKLKGNRCKFTGNSEIYICPLDYETKITSYSYQLFINFDFPDYLFTGDRADHIKFRFAEFNTRVGTGLFDNANEFFDIEFYSSEPISDDQKEDILQFDETPNDRIEKLQIDLRDTKIDSEIIEVEQKQTNLVEAPTNLVEAPIDGIECIDCKKLFAKSTIAKYDKLRCGKCYKKNNTSQTNTKTSVRVAINKALRYKVWEKRNPNTIRGKCYACYDQIDLETFECAHIIPVASGGLTNINNLEPTCRLCNRSCGTNNLNDFIKTIKKK